jgi:nitrogenase molybdenum-iron protein NifN
MSDLAVKAGVDEIAAPEPVSKNFSSTRNACKLCAPLGACIVYRGVEGCVPLIHGSQGCSTYIRRYGISHFREPIDIASSNFTESSAIFGGKENLVTAISNVTRQYAPRAIGVTSTCLSETIGEDVPRYMKMIEAERGDVAEPVLFYSSTASYRGTHMDGFHEAILSVVTKLAKKSGGARHRVNLVPGFVSAEDLREFREILGSFGVDYTMLPDYSETLDGGSWETYQKLPDGGTKLRDVEKMGDSAGTIYLGKSVSDAHCAGAWLEGEYGVPSRKLDLPIGIANTDAFFSALEEITGRPKPDTWLRVRGRVIDAYIDGHKYCSGKKAVVYGEEDFTVAMASFLAEIGVVPVIVATGAKSASFRARVLEAVSGVARGIDVLDDADFATMLERAKVIEPDFVIGSSKGYYLARNLDVPLVRCGFPIHDRMGGHRILHVGYRGTLNLFDLICNALMQDKQQAAKSGWTYI